MVKRTQKDFKEQFAVGSLPGSVKRTSGEPQDENKSPNIKRRAIDIDSEYGVISTDDT